MSNAVENDIIGLISGYSDTGAENLSAASELKTLGIDSMTVVEIIFSLEETYDIQIAFNANEEDASTFDISTIGSIAQSVQKLIDAKAG